MIQESYFYLKIGVPGEVAPSPGDSSDRAQKPFLHGEGD